MRLRDGLTILSVAGITMALVIALAGPQQVEAEGGADVRDQLGNRSTALQPVITQPTWEHDGLVIKVSTDKARYAAGEKPKIVLEVTNPSDEVVTTNVVLGLDATEVASPMSRIPAVPQSVWTEPTGLAVQPGETRRFEFATNHAVVENQSLTVTIGGPQKQPALSWLLDREQ